MASSQALAGQVVVEGELGQRLDHYMTGKEADGFSGAVLVAQGGRVLLQKGYGLADRESGTPVTPETVFTVGSLTKQFTGAVILKLEMMGRLATGDLISEPLDAVPEDKTDITLHHLLTHSAGFPDAIGGDFDTSADTETFLQKGHGDRTPLHARSPLRVLKCRVRHPGNHR
jgi:CubicO group peptidase (beta-lactamase class C family)